MDTGFRHEQAVSSAMNLNRHTISFQSAMNTTSDTIMMNDYHNRMNSTSNMMFSGHPSMINNNPPQYVQIGNSCSSILSDSSAGLKHDAGLAVEWSAEEQYKLQEGILKYADEPSIMRYIKIAATLHDKTVRDVALRCRWLTGKRRKLDELKFSKKFKDNNKDKQVESSSMPAISSISTLNVPPFSVTINNRFPNSPIPFEAISVSTRHLLEQNKQVLGQISANISALKLQENADLFTHVKNNITAILNDMRYLPGPPLPVSLNENLANTILPTTSQKMTFGSTSRMHMKQEPDY